MTMNLPGVRDIFILSVFKVNGSDACLFAIPDFLKDVWITFNYMPHNFFPRKKPPRAERAGFCDSVYNVVR